MESSYYFFPPFPKSGNSVFQFKISLKYPKPLIWRRVLVPGDYTFRDLHFVIQSVFGWTNSHMHKFDLKDRLTGEEIEVGGCGDLGFCKWMPESAKLGTYFKNGNDKATYDYDFGCTWYHNILLEKILPADPAKKYPQCIAGRMASPPEDGFSSDEENEKSFDAKLITFEKFRVYFKENKKVQSFKEFSSDDNVSDSSEFSSYSDNNSIRKKSGNTSSEVATTSTTKLVEQAIDNRQKVIDYLVAQNPIEKESSKLPQKQIASNTSLEVATTKLVEQAIDNRQKVIDYLVAQNPNETESSKLPQKRKALDDNELEPVPAKLMVLENKDLQISTTLETTRVIENSESDPSNSKDHAEAINVSNDTEDAEDYYGKFIASQMRDIKDLERREDLRIEIQQLISKYRFKN